MAEGLAEFLYQRRAFGLHVVQGLHGFFHRLPIGAREFEADKLVYVVDIGFDVGDFFGENPAAGFGYLLFAHFVKHVEIFLVEHVFVEHKGEALPRKRLPKGDGLRGGQKTSQHKRAGIQARPFALQAKGVGVFKKGHLALGGQKLIHPVLVLVRTHGTLHKLAHILMDVAVEPVVYKGARRLGMFAHVGANKAHQVAQVHNVGHLYRGNDVGVFLVGLFHANKNGFFLRGHFNLLTVEIV